MGKLTRDAKLMQLHEGTSQIQRPVIARERLLPQPVKAPVVEPASTAESSAASA